MIMYDITKYADKIVLTLPEEVQIADTDTLYKNNKKDNTIQVKTISELFQVHSNIALNSIIINNRLNKIKLLNITDITLEFNIDDQNKLNYTLPADFSEKTDIIDNPLYLQDFISPLYVTDFIDRLLFDLGSNAGLYDELIELTEETTTNTNKQAEPEPKKEADNNVR